MHFRYTMFYQAAFLTGLCIVLTVHACNPPFLPCSPVRSGHFPRLSAAAASPFLPPGIRFLSYYDVRVKRSS